MTRGPSSSATVVASRGRAGYAPRRWCVRAVVVGLGALLGALLATLLGTLGLGVPATFGAPADAPPAPGGAPDAAVEVRPYDRRLPDGDVDATVVVDAATGAPVAGARVALYEEDIDAGARAYDVVVAEQTTDAHGVASPEVPAGVVPGHWVVVAPGYAPRHAFGRLLPRVRLERGIRIAVRVLDPDDRPVAGARLEAYPADGCPHAPTFATYVADADGRAVLEDAPSEGYNLWITAAGFVTARSGVNGLSGTAAEVVVLDRGETRRGRLRAPDGAPLANVVVRATGFPRGPVTWTGADGRFELPGVEVGEAVCVVWPRTVATPNEDRGVTVRGTADVEADLVLDDEGLVAPAGSATLRLRVRGPKAAGAAPSVGVWVTRPDGVVTRARLAWDDEVGAYVGEVETTAGPFVVSGDDALDPCAIPPARGVVKDDEVLDVEVPATPRVPLRIEGLPDGGADVLVRPRGAPSAGVRVGDATAADARVPYLDAAVPVRIFANARGFYAVADVGPVVDGVRVARLAPPVDVTTTIRIHAARPFDHVSLGLGPDARYAIVEDGAEPGTFTTEVEGPVWLVVDLEAKDGAPETTRVVPIVLPPRGPTPATVTVSLDGPVEGERATGPVIVALVGPAGAPIPITALDAISLVGSGGLEGEEIETPVELDGPSVVRVAPPGLLPVVRRLETPGRHEIAWPAGTLTVIVTTADGAPVTGSALLAGTRFDVGAGRATIGGIPAGTHTVVVVASDGAAATATFVLADGEARSVAMSLPRPSVDVVTPFEGPYPGDEPSADAVGDVAVSSVLWDAETHRPAVGAVLRWYPEDASDAAWNRGVLLAEGTANAAGVASVAWAADEGTAHWVAVAPGRAPTHAVGARPPARMVLDAGRRLVGRVVDPLGRPVAGASIDLYLGCGHGPSGALATSEADGRFTIPHAPSESAYLWVSAPRHRGALHVVRHVFAQFAGAEARIVLAPAGDLTGTVLDPAGRPLPGCVVRQFQETRGPRAVVDDAGRFTLWGVTPGGDVSVHHVFTGAWLHVEATPDRPLTVRLAGFRPALPEPDGAVRVRARDATGAPAPDVRVALVGDDGRWHDAYTEDEPEGEGRAAVGVGEARLEVPAGRYEVRPADRFGAVTFRGAAIEAASGTDVAVEVVVESQTRMELEGGAPRGTHVYAGGARSAFADVKGVPPVGEVLVVGPDGEAVLLGAPDEGRVRRATLGPRPRRRVSWPADLDVQAARLTLDGHRVEANDDGASLLTDAGGALTLHLERAAGDLEAPVTLPTDDRRGDVAVTHADVGPPGRARLRWRAPAGVEVTLEGEAPRERAVRIDPALDADGRCALPFLHGAVTLSRPGHLRRRLAIDGAGTYEVGWGRGGFDLAVVDAGGAPVVARLVVDGEALVADPTGRLRLDGLDAGAHAVLVLPAGRGAGVLWRFDLPDGARRTKRLVLP